MVKTFYRKGTNCNKLTIFARAITRVFLHLSNIST